MLLVCDLNINIDCIGIDIWVLDVVDLFEMGFVFRVFGVVSLFGVCRFYL